MDYTIEDKFLILGDKKIEFDSKISEIIDFIHFVVLRTDYYSSQIAKNVYGINETGETIWQIENKGNSAYTGLTKIEANTIRLNKWDGTFVFANANTGEIIKDYSDSRQRKRPW